MRWIKYWLPAVLWMGIIFYFSSKQRVTVSDIPAIQFVFFKSLHILEYGFLYILLFRTFRNYYKMSVKDSVTFAWITAVFYGLTDEVHQVFIPTREGRMRDVAIDAIGISITAYILWKYLPKMPGKLKNWVKKLQLI